MKSKFWLTAGLILAFSVSGVSVRSHVIRKGNQMDGNAIGAKGLAPRSIQNFPPGIMFSTILSNVTVNANGGWLKLGNQMQNVFMPDPATGKVVISKVEGPEICHWLWELDTFGLRPPYKLFAFKLPRNPDGSAFDSSKLKLTQPGNYVVDFYLGEKRFYTFPFSVRALEPANPFDGQTLYLTDGAWNNWGYLMYPDANPEQNLFWKIWLRESAYKQTDHKVKVEVIRDQDKKLICQNREDVTLRFQHDWIRYSFDLVNPPVKTSSGDYFKAKDLLAVDGPYTLRMTIDGNLYGVWKFQVSGGKLNYTGRTVRGQADPLTFVEGGKDAWWYMKQTG